MPRLRPSDLKEIGKLDAAFNKFHAERVAASDEALGAFIERVSPHFQDPEHLAEMVDALEQAERAALGLSEPIFVCISVPPQHAKTETVKHCIAKVVSKHPEIFSAYLSYSADRAEDQSRSIRDYAIRAGTVLRTDTKSVALWRTPHGGGLAARGILGAVTGLAGLTIVVIDDPFKNWQEAESKLVRERVWSEFQASIWTRLRLRTSIIVIHTRWHEDDLIGRIKSDPELSKLFRFINLPAIKADGSALWPKEMPLELLRTKRAGSSERDWWSLYMGEPRPREGRVFQGVSYYDVAPATMRIGIGVDFAYTAKTSSDWNVAIVVGEFAEQFYILRVVRRQCTAPQWAKVLLSLQAEYPHAPMRAYIGGTERGSTDFIESSGVHIDARPATSDKYVRAHDAAAAWEKGRIHLPREDATKEGSDVAKMLDVVLDFTGLGDACDDDVDALSAAIDVVSFDSTDLAYTPNESTRLRPYGPHSSGSHSRRLRPH
jgi:hypothetical protein